MSKSKKVDMEKKLSKMMLKRKYFRCWKERNATGDVEKS